MKKDLLGAYKPGYETYIEILPKKSATIIVVGKARGIRDAGGNMVLEALENIKGIYKVLINEKEINLYLYKAVFQAFLDDSFIYYEHYDADYALSTNEIFDRLQRKKELAEEHLTEILFKLNKEVLVKLSFLSLFGLNQNRQQEIEKAIITSGGDIIQNEQTLRNREIDYYDKINYDIYFYNEYVCITSQSTWKDCHYSICSFVHSVKSVLPNPYILNLVRVLIEAYDKFLMTAVIQSSSVLSLNVKVLRGLRITIIEKVLVPTYMMLIPLIMLTIYMGIRTEDFLGMGIALGIYSLIIITLFWYLRSLGEKK
ncbi:MAG: hypothetical protein KAT65_29445 [Methanophagales archaeon]|nr:hypothetical protein [Methanophagales archaeon]